METVKWGKWSFHPSLQYTISASVIGCFSALMSNVRPNLGPPRNEDGTPAVLDAQSVYGTRYNKAFVTEFAAAQGITETSAALYFYGAEGAALGPNTWKKWGFDPEEMMEKAVLNSRKTLEGLGAGIYLMGDNLIHMDQTGSFTCLFPHMLEKHKIGVLSHSHAVLNPNHHSIHRLCQVWMWTPPKNARLTVTGGAPSLPPLARDIETLKHNIKDMYRNTLGYSEASRTLAFPPDPRLIKIPEKIEADPPKIEAEAPKVRTVRVRKPRTIKEAAAG